MHRTLPRTWHNKMITKKAQKATAIDFDPVFLQVVLHSTGDIVFAYKDIPLEIKRIGDKEHPVKVGLSDAYIIDRSGHEHIFSPLYTFLLRNH